MAIIIDIKLNTTGTKSNALDKMISKLEKLESQLIKVNQQFIHMNTLVGRLAQAVPSIRPPRANGGGSGSSGSNGPKPPSIQQQFQQAYQQFKFFNQLDARSGGKMGGAGKQASLQQAHSLAQQAMSGGNYGPMGQLLPHLMPKQPASLGQKLMTALSTSRIGMGGGGGMQIMPLVGRLAALNPVVGAAAVGIGAMAAAANDAREAMNAWASDRATLGGSALETARARAMAAAAGLDPNSASDSLRAAIKSGAGASYAAQAGINTTEGPYGDNNYSAKLIKALQFIQSSRTFDEARRRAEGLGMSGAASSWYASQGAKDRLNRSMAPAGDGEMKTAADLSANLAIINNGLDQFKIKLFGPTLEAVASIMDGFNRIGLDMGTLGSALSTTVMPGLQMFGLGLKGLTEWIDQMFPQLNLHSEAIQKNTEATESLNRTMSNNREFNGGGNRVRGAMPSKVRGQYLDPRIQAALGAGIPLG